MMSTERQRDVPEFKIIEAKTPREALKLMFAELRRFEAEKSAKADKADDTKLDKARLVDQLEALPPAKAHKLRERIAAIVQAGLVRMIAESHNELDKTYGDSLVDVMTAAVIMQVGVAFQSDRGALIGCLESIMGLREIIETIDPKANIIGTPESN